MSAFMNFLAVAHAANGPSEAEDTERLEDILTTNLRNMIRNTSPTTLEICRSLVATEAERTSSRREFARLAAQRWSTEETVQAIDDTGDCQTSAAILSWYVADVHIWALESLVDGRALETVRVDWPVIDGTRKLVLVHSPEGLAE